MLKRTVLKHAISRRLDAWAHAGVSLLATGALAAGALSVATPAQAAPPAPAAPVAAPGTGPAAAPVETNRPKLKPPKPTKHDRTIRKPDWGDNNHQPPPAPDAITPRTGTSREYGAGSQALTNTGVDGNVYNANPWVTFSDAVGHSLASINVSSDSQAQNIEVGWRKDLSGGNPKFFVSSHVNGIWQGYNTGFTLYGSRTYSPGDDVPAGDLGTGQNYVIQFDGSTTCGVSGTGAWWLGYKGTWFGYYCEQVWGIGTGLRQGTSDFAQVFHEIAYDTTRGFYCSDVGNGHDGSGGVGAAYFASVRFFGNATTNPPLDLFVRTSPTSPLYGRISVFKASNRTFYSGGPGSNSTNTAKGTNGAC